MTGKCRALYGGPESRAKAQTLNPSNTPADAARSLGANAASSMPMASPDSLMVNIGGESFRARLRRDLAPRSCEYLLSLLPYVGQVIHARWSGEALWAPLAAVIPSDLTLPSESATADPVPGQILLYTGERSVPELYIPYGVNRFACKHGPLEGNLVLIIDDGVQRLAEIGPEVLWKGAKELRIEVSP
jgi:hypothetical protein